MAFESTAINDLVAGLQQKPLPRESDDWLFGERDDATEIDPRVGEIPSLPRPNAPLGGVRSSAQPAPAMTMPALSAYDEPFLRHRSPTTHVRLTDWKNVAKKLAVPIAVFSIVIVVLGVYFAKTDEAPAPSKAAAAAPIEQPEPAQTIEAADVADVKIEVKAEEIEPAVTPKAEPPAVEAKEVAAAPVAAAPVAAAPVAAAPVAAAPVAAPVAAAPAEAPKVEEKLNVAAGSPASRFLAPAPVETTIKTAEKPSPAPTAVPDLPVPQLAKVVAAPAAAKVAKKPVRKVRADKRSAAQRVAKASVAASRAPAKLATPASNGKGILSIASTPSMEVWVDGRNSKAMTPVRIRLLAGKHKVTLFDKQRAKARSFEVQIQPDETTKVTKSYE